MYCSINSIIQRIWQLQDQKPTNEYKILLGCFVIQSGMIGILDLIISVLTLFQIIPLLWIGRMSKPNYLDDI